jgi:hypothetical protein
LAQILWHVRLIQRRRWVTVIGFLYETESVVWNDGAVVSSYWLAIELYKKLSSSLFMRAVMNWKNCLRATRRTFCYWTLNCAIHSMPVFCLHYVVLWIRASRCSAIVSERAENRRAAQAEESGPPDRQLNRNAFRTAKGVRKEGKNRRHRSLNSSCFMQAFQAPMQIVQAFTRTFLARL